MRVHTNCQWLDIFKPFGGGLGLTLRPHIWFRYTPTTGQLAHELVHLRQQADMGILKFLAVYFWQLRKLGKRPISELPLEAPAYAAEWAANEEQASSNKGMCPNHYPHATEDTGGLPRRSS